MKPDTELSEERQQDLKDIGSAFARIRPATPDVPMTAKPTLADIFNLRLNTPKFGLPTAAAPHCLHGRLHAMGCGRRGQAELGRVQT